MAERIAEVLRGGLVESVHEGHVAVVDADGRLRHWMGDPGTVTFLRSSAKPFQTMALVLSGAVDRFGFGDEELALFSASHNGEEEHTRRVEAILARVGAGVEHLGCGAHPPYDSETARRLAGPPTALHSNCSGKHAGMLAQARFLGADLEGYLAPDHPVQRRNLAVVARMTGVAEEAIGIGVDGCGVPTFAVPVARMALAFARLATGHGLDPAERAAAARVRDAMMRHPYLVAGRNRFDTDLMAALPGHVVAKGGAEGVECLGLPEAGLGIAIKVADGNGRAVGPVALAVLEALGLLPEAVAERLRRWRRPEVKNVAGRTVGEIRATVSLRTEVHS